MAKAEGFFVIRRSHPNISRGFFAAAAGKALGVRFVRIKTVAAFIGSNSAV